eukprot:jgi/Chlat1/5811/Chrsp4S06273
MAMQAQFVYPTNVDRRYRLWAWVFWLLLVAAFLAYTIYLVVKLVDAYENPSVTVSYNSPRAEPIALPSILMCSYGKVTIDVDTFLPRFFPRNTSNLAVDRGTCGPKQYYHSNFFMPNNSVVLQTCGGVVSTQAGSGLPPSDGSVAVPAAGLSLDYTLVYRENVAGPNDWCVGFTATNAPPMDPQTGFGFHLWFNGTFVDFMGADLLIAIADTLPDFANTALNRKDRWFYDIQTDVQGFTYLPINKVNRVTAAKTVRTRITSATSTGDPETSYAAQSVSSSDVQFTNTQKQGAYQPPGETYSQTLILWFYASYDGTLHIDENLPLFGLIGSIGGAWQLVTLLFFVVFAVQGDILLVVNEDLGKCWRKVRSCWNKLCCGSPLNTRNILKDDKSHNSINNVGADVSLRSASEISSERPVELRAIP